MTEPATQRPPLTPRHWPGWFAAGFLWLLGKAPRGLGMALSGPLGWLMARLMKGRRRIARRYWDLLARVARGAPAPSTAPRAE